MAWAALLLAVVSLFLAAASGPGYRAGVWGLGTGFGLLRWATVGALVSAGLSLIGLYVTRPAASRRGRGVVAAALLLGLAGAAPPLWWLWQARSAPLIHDITTDTGNPPAFEAILPLRAGAPNRAEYGGPEVAAAQRQAYPDIAPLQVALPPQRVFDAALAAARSRGWTVVAADPQAGRIEASDTTFWFGFVDDVVVRVTPTADGGSRVDVRSVSRVGLGDVGTNARRIRAFLRDLGARLA